MSVPDEPGGDVPQASSFLTIPYICENKEHESSVVDTDGSEYNSNSTIKRKRTATSHKVCKHCNKKRRRHKSGKVSERDCQCEHLDEKAPVQHAPMDSDLNSTPSVPNLVPTSDKSSSRQPIGRNAYLASDLSPYVIHIQKEQASPQENVTSNTVSFGFFLKKNGINNVIQGSLKKIGRNRLSVAFSSHEDANSFLNNSILIHNKYKAFIPSSNVTRMGVVRGVPSDWSDDDVVSNITVPIGCGNILKIRRLKRKNIVNGKSEFVPTETVVLTFDGQVLPKRVFMCYTSLPVDLYIYPTIQCFQCCRYGHIKSQCRSSPRCFKCGLTHSGDSCSVHEEDVTCCLCSGAHFATSKKCPEFLRQRNIKETMAKDCVTYAEAIKVHPPITKSYADVLLSSSTQQISSNPSVSKYDIRYNQTNKNSYKKTVFLKPKSPSKSISKGYDRVSHNSLTKDYNTPLYPSQPVFENNEQNNSFSELSVKELLITLINTLSQSKFFDSPSNVALPLKNLMNEINGKDGQAVLSSPVELP